MKNTKKYTNILLIIIGSIIFILLCFSIYNIFKNVPYIPQNVSTTPFPKIFPIIPIENENLIKPTLAQGDCFYSAIYRSLRDKNLLQNFCNCLKNIKCVSEADFIQSFRNFIANDKKLVEEYINIFYSIISEKSTDENFESNFNEIVKSLGDTRNVFINFNKENKFFPQNSQNFITDIQNIIKKRQTFVGQTEVTITKKLLENCNIPLIIIITDDKSNEQIFKEIKENNSNNKVLVVLSGTHYEYV
jgi:hypothetical protein